MKKSDARITSVRYVIFILMLLSDTAAAQDRLSRIEASFEGGQIEQVSFREIAQMLLMTDSDSQLLLFDVREPEEFEVGHLPGAIWLSPDADVSLFIEQYSSQLAEHTVVFYCSTGRRSSALALDVKTALQEQNSTLPAPANMKGGIFRWHNAALPLVNASGSTTKIHPFNWTWRLSLERSKETSYRADVSASASQ